MKKYTRGMPRYAERKAEELIAKLRTKVTECDNTSEAEDTREDIRELTMEYLYLKLEYYDGVMKLINKYR